MSNTSYFDFLIYAKNKFLLKSQVKFDLFSIMFKNVLLVADFLNLTIF